MQTGIPVARIELLDDVQMDACIRYSKLEGYRGAADAVLRIPRHRSGSARAIGARCGRSATNHGGSEFQWATLPEDRTRLWKATAHRVLRDARIEARKAYDFFITIEPANDIEVEVLEKAKKDWPNDYKMIVSQYNKQLEAYEDVMGIKPADEAEREILEKAKQDWPNDYSMIKYEYEEQLEAKNKLEKSQ